MLRKLTLRIPESALLFSGTSAQTAPPNAFFAAENPADEYDTDTGCTAPAGETVKIIDNSGSEKYTPIYPCFEHNTVTDLIDNDTNLSWKYYSTTTGSIWTAPNAIQHICLPSSSVDGTCQGQDWLKDVLPYIGPGKVLADLGVTGTCGLPKVS
jgi:hypothetical protein